VVRYTLNNRAEKRDIMGDKKKFCPRCNKWIDEPSVHTLGLEWVWFHQGLCPKCKATLTNESQATEKVDPSKFPTVMVVGIDGPFNLDQVLSIARRDNKELVVMGNQSPAFRDHNVLLREAPKFLSDPTLVIIFERSRMKSGFGDPLIIVRRTFLLDAARGLAAGTLGQLAVLLTMKADERNLKVSFI
jgi:hypothetical protein